MSKQCESCGGLLRLGETECSYCSREIVLEPTVDTPVEQSTIHMTTPVIKFKTGIINGEVQFQVYHSNGQMPDGVNDMLDNAKRMLDNMDNIIDNTDNQNSNTVRYVSQINQHSQIVRKTTHNMSGEVMGCLIAIGVLAFIFIIFFIFLSGG